MSLAFGRNTDSSLASRCSLLLAPLAPAHITSQWKGEQSSRRKGSGGNPEMVIPAVAAELSAKQRTPVSLRALIAKHVCTRMGFRNSDRALPVFRFHLGKVDLFPVEMQASMCQETLEVAP